MESESEESSEEEEEEDNEDIDAPLDESGLVTPAEGTVSSLNCYEKYIFYFYSIFFKIFSGMVTPSGLTSVTAGMETPDTIELRKKKIESEMEE